MVLHILIVALTVLLAASMSAAIGKQLLFNNLSNTIGIAAGGSSRCTQSCSHHYIAVRALHVSHTQLITAPVVNALKLSHVLLAAELYGSEAIVCLTSAAGTNPATLQPRRYTHEDGYDVCVRYQSLIDTDWTWVYGATSSSKCAQLMQQPGQYRNVQCCMERNCNMPDPVLDPATEVADLPAPAASLQPAEAGDHLPARLRRLLRYSRSHTPSGRASVGSLTCYRTLHKKGAQADHVSAVAPKTYRKSGSMDVCTRYTYKCADGDMACSTADVKAGLWKWMYAPLSAATCLELKGYSKKADALIKQVKCCTSPLCNAPDGERFRLCSKVYVIVILGIRSVAAC